MVLITGGNGFIGTALVEKLLSEGHSVSILDRNQSERRNDKAKVIKGDITDPASLAGAFKGEETVIHLAGMISYSKPREELMRVNSIGTKNVVEACRSTGVDKFILSSSVSVYGRIKRGDVADESYAVRPMNPYGESKMEAEKWLTESGIDSVILRIAPIYGIGSPSWMKNLKLLEKGFPIPNTKNLTHVAHVSDVVQAFVLAVEGGKGVYNIADSEPLPFVRFAEMLMKDLGRKPRKMPPFLVGIMARAVGMKTYLNVLTANRHYDISAAKAGLKFSPKADLEKSTKEMVDWYLANKSK